MTKLANNPTLRWGAISAAGLVAAVVLFGGPAKGLFRSDQFMPHATCYLRNPKVILLHVTSDLFIGLSYVSISSTLAYLVYKSRKDIPFHWMFLAFGLFIITCGFTHFMEVLTVWRAVYWLAGAVKVVCAAASVATAIALFPLIPRIFALITAEKVSEERRKELERANAELETFAYSVSHDLRAPLRAVTGMANVMREDHGVGLEPAAVECLNRIRAASSRMDTLICALLEYSRVARADVDLERVGIGSVLEQAKAVIEADLVRSGAEIQVEGSLPAVAANETLLTQVIANLLGNAIKFVGPGVKPIVQIFTRESSGNVRIHVKDNGLGIAPQHQQRIFRVFERLHNDTKYPGTGIGLAIVQKAVDRMKGTLGLESALGHGSCFWIELPRA